VARAAATLYPGPTPGPPMTRRLPLLALVATLLLAACGPTPEEQAAAKRAAEQAREAKVAPALAVYREARGRGDAVLAVQSAEVVLADGPGTAAAAEVAEGLDALRAEAAVQAEHRRLAGLWGYVSTPIEGEARPQKAATLRNQRPDEDDPGNFAVVPTVQLVLRDDPRWGQSVYLVIEEGTFECGRPCAFTLRFDGADGRRWAGKAASTGTRPALFIEDDRRFIEAIDRAGRLEVAPAHGRFPPIVFEVGGFDPARYAAGA